MRLALRLACAVVLVGAACDQGQDRQGKVQKLDPLAEGEAKRVKVPTAETGAAPPARVRPPPSPVLDTPPGNPAHVAVGMTRHQLVQTLGSCARRTHLFPGNRKGSLTVEVFQPRAGKCQEDFGRRRFFVAGDRLANIEPDVEVEAPPPAPDPAADQQG